MRLTLYRKQEREDLAIRIANAVGKMLGGEKKTETYEPEVEVW